jgi:hypothetical protein
MTPTTLLSKPIAEMTDRELVIAGLREFADFLDAHPAIPATPQKFLCCILDRDEFLKLARVTSWRKVYESPNFFTLRKTFGSGAELDVYTDRENVCRKVVKGTRFVAAQPATEAHEEEIVEWVCEEASLLAGAK